MPQILPTISCPSDLSTLSLCELEQLADEMREALCSVMSLRSAHFASNLGVVELAIALHQVFDFRTDRLLWDTGHQVYPHKLLTGRNKTIHTIRTKGGLMGYPNPVESEYDLFMTGHAGSSLSTLLGLRSGDDLLRADEGRHAVAVVGDGAFPSGVVFEAMNNLGRVQGKLLVILNDNQMSICPRVGGLADYLDRLRVNPAYTGLKEEVVKVLNKVPLLGDPVERFLTQVKESIKAGLHGGMLFEELGFRYIGPIDGHNIGLLRKYLRMVKGLSEPVLLHVVTKKGHGFEPAERDPAHFHAPPRFERDLRDKGRIAVMKEGPQRTYSHVASDSIYDLMQRNPRITVLTAAMCQGNQLERIRDEIPDRFFDVGICEAHAVAFAAGQAKAGLRPIVDIYSTFLQRAFDHIFQEVALQNLPVTFMMDRAGLTGPDGPTHHGAFDISYLRLFPNLIVMAPGDEYDLPRMLDLALSHDAPSAIRYPKMVAKRIPGERTPVTLGGAEVIAWGEDGCIVCYGALLPACVAAANALRAAGLDVGVINARFSKPLDQETISRAIKSCHFVVTVEENALIGGFGSAVLEMASAAGLDTRAIHRLGIPDHFVEHGDRSDLLADLGLSAEGIAATCRELAATSREESTKPPEAEYSHPASC
ncbi:MAG: 1-deoxy-D-xylulose-5-phosphate synthase [Pirellulales bacterium]|nr:1-deoxy-D-xylulose-5-phosphate synthase [Pirellulales bacterium]